MKGTGCHVHLLVLALASSCAAGSTATQVPLEHTVEHWGGMREVLREGRTEGRIDLADVLGPNSIAVGATAGLAAEITVDAGEAHIAEVVDPDSAQGLRTRGPAPGEQATLLVIADVPIWSEYTLPALPDLAELEASLRSTAAANGIDVTTPFPFRVEGEASTLHLHVLNHSCPIADPRGPKPWRFAGENEPTVLVGFHAQGSAGRLTHHGQRSHTHALLTARDISGHVDEVSFPPGARLFLPAR